MSVSTAAVPPQVATLADRLGTAKTLSAEHVELPRAPTAD
jgi:hypothetical protein